MTLVVEVPGWSRHAFDYLLLDINGTLTDRGHLMDGVEERLGGLTSVLDVRLLSTDTFGSAANVADQLGVALHRVDDGEAKLRHMEQLGPGRCVAIGNGANDVPMLRAAGLSLAVMGPEGTSTKAAMTADVLCRSALDALDLLLHPRMLTATLRT
jgi:soluble P-type ATPase